MLGGLSGLPETPAAAAAAGGAKDEEGGDRSSAGTRWPTEETLALLKVRSDMDLGFKDSGFKAPLWEKVSQKMGELGYHRSAKKCKEKFENIYKYHKRTKEQHNAKNYRFFEQLEAFESHQPIPIPVSANPPLAVDNTSVENTMPTSSADNSDSAASSSSEEETEVEPKQNRKLVKYFDRLMKKVLEKQERLQRQFIEALEKYERERIAREEAWKVQELARLQRERELLEQERSIAAAKDAAVLAFLQKFADQSGAVKIAENPAPPVLDETVDYNSSAYTDSGAFHASSSRWPKEEVEALISLKSGLDVQYHESGPKGPLWEEIASKMKRLGYDRSGKRCKEKWENINKYYKRVKESKRKRPDDSKTCPYFEQLDALYRRRTSNSKKGEEALVHMTDRGEEKQEQQEPAKGDRESENAGHEVERENDDRCDGSEN